MDATHLFKRAGIDGPYLIVLKVPLRLEAAGKFNIDISTVVLDIPVVAVSGNHTGFVFAVFFPKCLSHLRGIVKYTKIVVKFSQSHCQRLSTL